ncbi:Transglycosylase, SLT family [Candidatus Glomeribacter gigasporarum BEG34]|uniref:Transglycosylase, SLT family n=1 Tax=Candidatus Glomeribacter gigasporarum BEG34 TaxID=1070319 RepID=G2J7Y0_9BURK|nr:transglycosylase SLT domain-containing protein [Candidatus Glomeribacter gigasporarum]CCD28877.1 Transglycosylase, SLT family [Candidatus Glomeribacter gigasporarum BEG34]
MNLRLSQAVRWTGRATYATVRYSARLAHRFTLAVGLIAILIALTFWLSPLWRQAFTAQLRMVFSATAPPDFRRLLADDSSPARMRYPSGQGALASRAFFSQSAQEASAKTVCTIRRARSDIGKINEKCSKPERRIAQSPKQARISDYLAHRYRVARMPVGNLVKAAFSVGQEFDLDPLLLLAVIAIESRFNPYAESGVGAQGLMQVMSRVHLNKFDYFGGPEATLDPLVNLKVGALILKECIARGGSLTEGLRRYVGALPSSQSSYAGKVLAERRLLHNVARGLNVSVYASRGTHT